MTSTAQLLIRQARILLPNGNFQVGDVEITEGKITQIANHLKKITLIEK